MRVICKKDSKIGSLEVSEITEIGFDDDITGIKDDNGEYDRFKDLCITGLSMIDTHNNRMYIKNISLSKCNEICQEILKTGCYDLSEYGEYEFLEIDD